MEKLNIIKSVIISSIWDSNIEYDFTNDLMWDLVWSSIKESVTYPILDSVRELTKPRIHHFPANYINTK